MCCSSVMSGAETRIISSPFNGPLAHGNCSPRYPLSAALRRAPRRRSVRYWRSASAAWGSVTASGGNTKRLDVPHDLAPVVVVVGPVGEPEHRRAEEGRSMRRGVEVIEGRVGKCLPSPRSAHEAHAAAPELAPCFAVLFPQTIEPELRADRGQSRRLAMRFRVHLAGDERG